MAGDVGIDVRCPRCGREQSHRIDRTFGSPVRLCVACGAPLVVVPDHDPPPLYTWEVFANLYPSAPIPRGNPYRWAPAIVALLWGAVIVLAGLAAALTAVGLVTSTAGPMVVAGTVETENLRGTSLVPVPGALVEMIGESGQSRSTVTDAAGVFRFAPVAVGGITLNVSYRGLSPVTLQLFGSPFYTTTGLAHLSIDLASPGNTSSGGAVETNFPNLESYLTSVGTGVVLLSVGATLGAMAARAARRRRIGPLVAAGGAAAAAASFSTFALGLAPVFIGITVASAVAMTLGGLGAALAGAYRWLVGPFEGDAPARPILAAPEAPGPRDP